jgi:hypothetical protein
MAGVSEIEFYGMTTDEPSSYIMSRMYCWEKKEFPEIKSSRQDIKRETRTESSAEFFFITVSKSYSQACTVQSEEG